MELAGPPSQRVPVPEALTRIADGAPLELVWANSTGGLTARITHPDGARFAKWNPATSPVCLDVERRRLEWPALAPSAPPFPRVIDHGSDAEGEWLVTIGLPGVNAVSGFARRHRDRAAATVGQGLRLLHDSLEVASCPFAWGVTERINSAHRLGIEIPTDLLSPPALDLVVCHGDPCPRRRSHPVGTGAHPFGGLRHRPRRGPRALLPAPVGRDVST